jgi:hypothetical protein
MGAVVHLGEGLGLEVWMIGEVSVIRLEMRLLLLELLMVCHVVVLAVLKRWLWRRHHLRSKRRSKSLSPVGAIGAITIIKLIMRIIMSMARMFFLTKFLK